MPARPAPDLPIGTVTFLFTDIEGSTQLVAALGDGYGPVLEEHALLIRKAIADHAGREVSTEGDAFFAVFSSAVDAVRAAADAQRALASQRWPRACPCACEWGCTPAWDASAATATWALTCIVQPGSRLPGTAVRCSSRMQPGCSSSRSCPDGLAVRNLADHRLKDLPMPERIWQLDIAGLPADFPAIRSLDARRGNLPTSPTPFIGREAELAAIAELVRRRPLLTLVGPGGSGKTRLGLAAAERLSPEFADGAFFVALQDSRDPEPALDGDRGRARRSRDARPGP